MVSARTIIGIIGDVIAFLLFLSPVPTFNKIVNRGNVGNFSEMPYLAGFLNCGIWVLYGLPVVHPNNLTVLAINGVGFFIEMVYLVLFYIYSAGNQKTRVRNVATVEALFVVLLGIGLIFSDTSTEDRSWIVGFAGVATNIFMYGSPLSVMWDVIKTQNVENMSFLLSLFSFLNGITWLIFALIPIDPFIAIPNGFGAVLALFQLILYGWYYGTTQQQLAEGGLNSETEDLLSNDSVEQT